MSPETKVAKAHRYLAEGRVRIERADEEGLVVATIRGDSGTHSCGWDPGRSPHWRCTCPHYRLSASHPDCSHLIAVKLIVERPA